LVHPKKGYLKNPLDSPEYQAFEEVMQQVAKRVREQLRILADERGNRKINRRLKEAMKRIERALLHNPDLCPFGLVARGEEHEEEEKGPPPEEWKEPIGRGKERPKFEKPPGKRLRLRSLTSTGVIRQLKVKLLSHLDNPHLAYQRQSKLMLSVKKNSEGKNPNLS